MVVVNKNAIILLEVSTVAVMKDTGCIWMDVHALVSYKLWCVKEQMPL